MGPDVMVKDDQRFIVLGGAMLHEEDHQQVVMWQKKEGVPFVQALADYIKELREYHKQGESISKMMDEVIRG